MQYICGFDKEGNLTVSVPYVNEEILENAKDMLPNIENVKLLDDKEFKLCQQGYYLGEDSNLHPPKINLEALKKAKLTEVDQWTANKITGGFVSTCYNGENILYDTDTETQLTMTKARANCEGERFAQAFPNGMGVRGYEQTGFDDEGNPTFDSIKTVHNFLPEHIIAWDEDFSLHLAKCKYEGWIMQDKVNACTTKEELESIVLG